MVCADDHQGLLLKAMTFKLIYKLACIVIGIGHLAQVLAKLEGGPVVRPADLAQKRGGRHIMDMGCIEINEEKPLAIPVAADPAAGGVGDIYGVLDIATIVDDLIEADVNSELMIAEQKEIIHNRSGEIPLPGEDQGQIRRPSVIVIPALFMGIAPTIKIDADAGWVLAGEHGDL